MIKLTRLKNLFLYYISSGSQNWKNRPAGLYCFNYHRIGDANRCEFDPNVFSCNVAKLEKHLNFYKKNFRVVNLSELYQILKTGEAIEHRLALLTFDDGYEDNYNFAYPLLKKYKLSATFFVTTDFIDKDIIPWWDKIAWIIKNRKKDSFHLPSSAQFISVTNSNVNDVIKKVLDVIKNSNVSIESFINELKLNAGLTTILEHKENLFMSWNMLREMQENSMDIGSHGCSHHILSNLSEIEQYDEIYNSKAILEANLDTEILSFAFPVGNSTSYTNESCRLLEEAKYKLGFSYISGINQHISVNSMDLRRLSVSNNCSILDLKLICANAKP